MGEPWHWFPVPPPGQHGEMAVRLHLIRGVAARPGPIERLTPARRTGRRAPTTSRMTSRLTSLEDALDAVMDAAAALPDPRRRLVGWLALDVDAALAEARTASTARRRDDVLATARQLIDDLAELCGTTSSSIGSAPGARAFERLFAEGSAS